MTDYSLEPWKIRNPDNKWKKPLSKLINKYSIKNEELFFETVFNSLDTKAWIDYIDSSPNITEQRKEIEKARKHTTELINSITKIIGSSSPFDNKPPHDKILSSANTNRGKTIFAQATHLDTEQLFSSTIKQLNLLIERLDLVSEEIALIKSKRGRKPNRGTNLVINDFLSYWANDLNRKIDLKHTGIDDTFSGEILDFIHDISEIVRLNIASKYALGKKISLIIKKDD